jgi:hypothetical protein
MLAAALKSVLSWPPSNSRAESATRATNNRSTAYSSILAASSSRTAAINSCFTVRLVAGDSRKENRGDVHEDAVDLGAD